MREGVDDETVADTPLTRYNVKAWEPNAAEVEANVTRLFVWHGFSKGFMYVRYFYKGEDASGKLLTASGPLISKWTIQKIDGEWVITDIEEAP